MRGDCGCTTAAPAAAAPCGQQYVTKKVCVPEMVTEERTCSETVCVPETRTCKVACCEVVPVTKTVPCTYTVMVPHVQKRMETYLRGRARDTASDRKLSGPGADLSRRWRPTIRSAFRFGPTRRSSVPFGAACETRQGTRCETHCVPVKETCMHCVDKGHWEDRPLPACGPCQTAQTVRAAGYRTG